MDSDSKFSINMGQNPQGTVIGDGNAVYQQFYAASSDIPIPVAPLPPKFFMGRDEILKQLSDSMNGASLSGVLGLWGVAGVGKSALASAFANSVAKQFPDGCLWCDIRQAQGNRRAILETLALSLGQDPRLFPGDVDLFNRVRSLLAKRQVLLVFDNVSILSEVEPFVELTNKALCVALLTTRNREVAVALADQILEVAPLADDIAELLLRQHCQVSVDVDLKELVVNVKGIPLLIQSVGQQIRIARPSRKAEVIHKLQEQLVNLPNLLKLYAGELPYRDILLFSFDTVSPLAQRVLLLMGLLSPRPVTFEMLQQVLGYENEQLHSALEILQDVTLVEENGDKDYQLPGVIHALAAELVEESTGQAELFDRLVKQARFWIENLQDEIDLFRQHNVLAHIVALYDMNVRKRAWANIRYLGNVAKRPAGVTAHCWVIYNTNWPLASMSLTFEENAYLDDIDWHGASFGNVSITEAWLHNIRLIGANLGNIHAKNSTFQDVDMRGSQAGNLYFSYCIVDHLDLQGTKLENLYFDNCRINFLFLHESELGNIYLTDCVVVNTDLSVPSIHSLHIAGKHALINVSRLDSSNLEED